MAGIGRSLRIMDIRFSAVFISAVLAILPRVAIAATSTKPSQHKPVLLAQQAQSQPTPKSPAKIFEEVSPSTIQMICADSEEMYTGSGFVVKPGIVITNFHVLEGCKYALVRVPSKNISYKVDGVLAFDSVHDLVALSVQTNSPNVKLGTTYEMRIGEKAFVIGSPKGLQNTFSDGLVSGLHRAENNFQITAPISPGSSGGPVLNSQGEVIGVSVAFREGGQNLNFAIPVEYVKDLLARVPAPPGLQLSALPTRTRISRNSSRAESPSAPSSTPETPFVDSLWRSYYEAAETAMKNNSFEQASQMFGLAVKESRKIHSPDERLRSSMLGLAKSLIPQGQYALAENLVESCEHLDEHLHSTTSFEYSDDLQVAALIYQKLSKWDKAEEALSKSLNIEESSGLESPGVLAVLNKLAEVYQAQSKHVEAQAITARVATLQSSNYQKSKVELPKSFDIDTSSESVKGLLAWQKWCQQLTGVVYRIWNGRVDAPGRAVLRITVYKNQTIIPEVITCSPDPHFQRSVMSVFPDINGNLGLSFPAKSDQKKVSFEAEFIAGRNVDPGCDWLNNKFYAYIP